MLVREVVASRLYDCNPLILDFSTKTSVPQPLRGTLYYTIVSHRVGEAMEWRFKADENQSHEASSTQLLQQQQ